MQLTVDTSWWTRYRSSTPNPDLGDVFPPAVPTLATGEHPAIPRTDADLKPLRRGKLTHRIHERQSCPHRPFGIVLVGSRVTEVNQHAVAHVLGDEPVKARDGLGDALLVGADDVAQVLGIKPRGERRRTDQIHECDRKLPTLGRGWARRGVHMRCFGDFHRCPRIG